MKIQIGYLYHIKNEFCSIIEDKNLMANHENKGKRPSYFVVQEKGINLFFVNAVEIKKKLTEKNLVKN